MSVENAYQLLYAFVLLVFAVLIGITLVRAVIGPRVTDRIMSINMIGTMVIASIIVLSGMLGEGYLLDVALIYAMISFVTVLILAASNIPPEKRKRMEAEEKAMQEEDA